MQFDQDPLEDHVETVWVAYECGWTNLAPVDEVDKVPDKCVCGADQL